MKAIILAGGLGTRLSEETHLRPKPMVEIGGRPILWHIMKMYSAHGINDFIVCCGYKGYFIKEYFNNYYLHVSDVTFDYQKKTTAFHASRSEPWRVTLADTGELTMTGGRLARVYDFVKDDEHVFVTYGDGVGDINISDLFKFHLGHQKKATITAASPEARFGALALAGSQVKSFQEKPSGEGGFINAGFFVLRPSVLREYITEGDKTVWEHEPLTKLALEGELMAYRHAGFWQPMDTLRDKDHLERLWAAGNAPWKMWKD